MLAGSPSAAAVLLVVIMMISVFGSNQMFVSAAPSNDGASDAGQCDLPQRPSSAEANPASLVNQSRSLVLKDRIWISVRQIDFNEASWWVAHSNDNPNAVPQQVISCTLLTSDNLRKIPKIAESIEGADSCRQGVEICELPAGVSIGGEVEYKSSITDEEAEEIANEVSIVANKAILQQQEGGKYYFLQLFTTNDNVTPQVRVEFLDVNRFVKGNSIHLEKGQSITIPFTVRTFATFGKPANFTIIAGAHARDSGLTFRLEPSSAFIIPERSTAKANLTIAAGMNATDGVYRFFMSGKDGWIRTCGLYTDYTA